MSALRGWTVRRRVRGRGQLATVLIVGVITRAILIPITHGPDFTVWDLASRATLSGVNVYAHHPAYDGGPFAYFPLFLYVELPMQWLALHTGVSFTVFGKLPIVGADLLIALLIVGELGRQRRDARVQAIAAAVFFLNPLVVYNGAFYGRFDSVAVALLLLAVTALRTHRPVGWRAAFTYALSVATKTFPIFILPRWLRHDRTTATRALIASGVVLVTVSAPYLITSPRALATDLLYSADKLSGGLSWQVVLHGLPAAAQLDIAAVLLGIFVIGAVALGFVEDAALCAAATMVLFLVLSKQVIEQYLIWPLPFLALVAAERRSRAAWLLIAVLTVAGALVNAYIHPWGLQPPLVNVAFAGVVSLTLARLLATELSKRGGERQAGSLPAVGCPRPAPAGIPTPAASSGSGGRRPAMSCTTSVESRPPVA
jgi:hypothetical protein